ncbi:hypothetical protein AB0L05_24720 [Nonomuraea pusilla]|uniref:hypothetical protein n=1 Tax=Nonomuraea pusilla TaxID=46177 RepID=UPI0033176936
MALDVTADGRHSRPRQAPHPSTPHPGPRQAAGANGRRAVYREEAVRRHIQARAGTRMPLVVSSPSFVVLWLAVAAVLAAGALVTALALGAF